MPKKSSTFPYRYLEQFNDTDFAWLAGMIEADGHISYTRSGNKGLKYLEIGVSNTDPKIINKVADIMDSNPNKISKSKNNLINQKYNTKEIWRVEVSGHKAEILFQKIYSYLVSDKKIIKFQRKNMTIPHI